MKLTIDGAATSLRLHTRAKGLLSKLAHDLAIDAREVEGSVELDGSSWRAELTIPVSSLRIAGVLRHERVEAGVLSGSDVLDIERRIRDELLPARHVTVEAEGTSLDRGQATVRCPRGDQHIRFDLRVADDKRSASVETRVSLKALRVPEVKGPLGAFKLADAVEVIARLALSE
jgi:hypothetical protein